MGVHVIMNLAETRKRRRLYVLLSVMFALSGLVGSLMALLKHLYVMRVAQGSIAHLIRAIWDVPYIPWLWEHASLVRPGDSSVTRSSYILICFGLLVVSAVFGLLVKRHTH